MIQTHSDKFFTFTYVYVIYLRLVQLQLYKTVAVPEELMCRASTLSNSEIVDKVDSIEKFMLMSTGSDTFGTIGSFLTSQASESFKILHSGGSH